MHHDSTLQLIQFSCSWVSDLFKLTQLVHQSQVEMSSRRWRRVEPQFEFPNHNMRSVAKCATNNCANLAVQYYIERHEYFELQNHKMGSLTPAKYTIKITVQTIAANRWQQHIASTTSTTIYLPPYVYKSVFQKECEAYSAGGDVTLFSSTIITNSSSHIQLTNLRFFTRRHPMTLIQMKGYKVYTTRRGKRRKTRKVSTLDPFTQKNVSVHQVVQLA